MINRIAMILIAHYIGDFLLQTRWMGENKSKSFKALAIHILVYSACLLPFGWEFALANGILHMITDAISSRLSGRAYRNTNMKQFWDVIGADQLVHALCLLYTAQVFLGFI